MEDSVIEINWISIITVTFSIVGGIVGAATAYLRLFVANQMNINKEAILKHMDEKFALRELVETKLADTKDDIKDIKAEIQVIKGELKK